MSLPAVTLDLTALISYNKINWGFNRVSKRILCTVVRTKNLYPIGDTLVGGFWGESSRLQLSVPAIRLPAQKTADSVIRVFADLAPRSWVIDYYA